MDITATKDGGNSINTVPGNLDVMTSAAFKQTLDEVILDSTKIELDFTKTVLVSSAGLRVLLQAEKNVKKAEKNIVFKNVSPEVMEIFKITGVDKIFTIE